MQMGHFAGFAQMWKDAFRARCNVHETWGYSTCTKSATLGIFAPAGDWSTAFIDRIIIIGRQFLMITHNNHHGCPLSSPQKGSIALQAQIKVANARRETLQFL